MMDMMGDWSPLNKNNYPNNMMNYYGNHMGWFGSSGMILWWTLIIVGIIALVVWLKNPRKENSSSALNILKEGYAKGEITKQEFEEKKKELS